MGRISDMVAETKKSINELDVVVITQNIPEHGIISGDVGTVVHCYNGGEAYEVEVVAANGHTVALMTLDGSSVRLKQGWEISHVREHSPVSAGEEVGGYYPHVAKERQPRTARVGPYAYGHYRHKGRHRRSLRNGNSLARLLRRRSRHTLRLAR